MKYSDKTPEELLKAENQICKEVDEEYQKPKEWPTITKDTTVDEIFEIHRRIWDEVIKTFMETDYAISPITPYSADCALCEYNAIHNLPCCKCLADWGDNRFGFPRKCAENPNYIVYLSDVVDEFTLEALKAVRDIPRKRA